MAIVERTELVDGFLARCELLGVVVHRCEIGGLAAAIVAALRTEGARSVLLADDLGGMRPAIEAALANAGTVLIEGDSPADAEPAEAGVGRSPFGVAETGSLAVIGNALQPRLATMLPPVHVAILDQDAILPSLDEAFARLERAMRDEGVRYATLVTGPSRTADVEKTLAVGVHGPRVVHVVLVQESDS